MKIKKKTYRRRNYKRKFKSQLGRPSRGLKQSVYLFKRKLVQVIQMNTQNPPDIDPHPPWEVGQGNSLYNQIPFKLSDLREGTDFANLFLLYKITAVKAKYIFSQTQTAPVHHENSPQTTNSNAQILVMTSPWVAGESRATDAFYMKDCQASKTRIGLNGGKPITMYMPCKQLSVRYRSGVPPAATFDYASVKPRWISVTEPDTPHYGLNICFQRADQTLFAADATNYQFCRIEYTYYIACKGVH